MEMSGSKHILEKYMIPV